MGINNSNSNSNINIMWKRGKKHLKSQFKEGSDIWKERKKREESKRVRGGGRHVSNCSWQSWRAG